MIFTSSKTSELHPSKLQKKYLITYILKDRYDLSEVGRVKLNSKLNLNTSSKRPS